MSHAQTVSITSSASGAICAGTSVTFTATPTGITTPTYQWYKNGTAISGATNATYTTSSLSNNDQISVQATPGYTAGSISTTGLIANFDAANYNTSSTRWNDQSSSANHMDFYTDRTYSTLKTATYSTEGGGSLNVNNNSVFGKTINNTGISGNGGKTMSAWIKFDATDAIWSSIASIGEYAAAKVFEIYVQTYPNSQLIFHWSGGQVSNYTDLTQNTWYYVTIKSDGSSGNYIYINGIQVAYATQTLNITNSPLYMGASKTRSDGGWDYNLRGKISTLSLYNTALSAQTILDNYNATKGRYTSTSIASNTITSSITAGPSTPTITVTGDACINKTTLNTPSGLSSYTWYKDNVAIAGATTTTYSPTVAGDYKVVVSNGTCSTTSAVTAIYTCGVSADGRMVSIANPVSLLSMEGGANFGTGIDNVGKILNTTGLTTTTGTIAATTAVLGGIISATNAVTSSFGVIYSTDINFGTYSSSTIQSNVASGTYTTTITGLTSETTYYAKSFVVNKAGTSYGPVVSFTTPARPVAVGDSYRGGIVVYIAGPSDPGYDANTTHGLIAAKVDLGSMNWNYGSRAYVSDNFFGAGIGNTAIIIAQAGTSGGNYAAKACDNYSVTETVGGITTTYDDWYLGSVYEIQKMLVNRSYLTGLLNGYYWSSSEQTATGPAALSVPVGLALYVGMGGGADQWNRTNGSGIMGVRAIRKF